MEMRLPLPAGALAPARLRRRCDPAAFPFATTAELADVSVTVGQTRALGAIEFAVGMQSEGYNLFAMGPEGLGKHTLVRSRLEAQAAGMPAPADWCYVLNFEAPHKPRALRLPGGRAQAFKASMKHLVEDLLVAIPAAFETEEYRNRRQQIELEFSERQEHAANELGERARIQGIALVRTPSGFGFGPFGKEKDTVMTPEDFQQLPAAEQQRYESAIAELQKELGKLLLEMPKWRREALRKLRELSRQVSQATLNGLLEELRAEYANVPDVVEHLGKVHEDMLEHADAFRQSKDGEPQMLFGMPITPPEGTDSPLRRYAVNVLIAHSGSGGAPVVYEDHPSHDALVGRIEHISQMGTLVTDFTLIKAGALHRANGGYLVLDALKLLTEPYAWDALKRALRSREIRIQTLAQALGFTSTTSLEPEPIPLEVKVVLVGQRALYYLLHAYDPEFAALFKVMADFEDEVPRDAESELVYARVIGSFARKENLLPLEREAVACVLEQQSRDAGDAGRISASMQQLVDLLRESNYWAKNAGRTVIGAADVRRALEAQIERADRVRDRLLEEVLHGAQLIDTAGTRAGQVNGLGVVQLANFAFGTPHRITARVRLGSRGVVDIEREAELGGPIHSKGVLILSGFLSGRYAAGKPLSLSASLVFEQSYGGIEGDSASSAELYALISALADAPLKQSLAVTGSVNQHGDIQAIGGVNEKIEGFFDLCRSRGLSGEQGVLIPASNLRNLMLREDVVEAVEAGRFNVYAVRTVDEGIELLTGLPAAAVHARVESRLGEFANQAKAFALPLARKPWQAKAPR
jgi:lon-related putative ATP-dependent protease